MPKPLPLGRACPGHAGGAKRGSTTLLPTTPTPPLHECGRVLFVLCGAHAAQVLGSGAGAVGEPIGTVCQGHGRELYVVSVTKIGSTAQCAYRLVGCCSPDSRSAGASAVDSPSNRKPSLGLALLLSSVAWAVTHPVPLLDACRRHRWSGCRASCSSAAARWLPRLPWPRGPSSRTPAAGSAIDIALIAASARHVCSMQLRGSGGAGLAGSHASRRWSWAARTS